MIYIILNFTHVDHHHHRKNNLAQKTPYYKLRGLKKIGVIDTTELYIKPITYTF